MARRLLHRNESKHDCHGSAVEPSPCLQPPWWHARPPWPVWVSRAMLSRLKAGLLRYLVFRGDKVRYLCHLGVHIGSHCSILNDVQDFGTEPWLVEIGNRVSIAHGVVFLTHDASSRLFRQQIPGSSEFGNRFGTIRVLDNCFVGLNSILLPDVVLGPNSIVGAGSIVTKNVPANTVAAGVPARPICTLDEYVETYRSRMVPIEARDRRGLRRELTQKFWGHLR